MPHGRIIGGARGSRNTATLQSRYAPRLAAQVAALIIGCAGAPAAAGAGGAGPTPPGEGLAAEAALDAAVDALAPTSGQAPDREATIALAELAASLPALQGADRARAHALLARPTDGVGDPLGDGYAVGEEPPACSPRFCVHYVKTTADRAAHGYAAEIAAIAEFSYAHEVEDLGWAAPRPDGHLGGDARIDIYLKELGQAGLYGYQASDPGQGKSRRKHGYLVIDNDYAASEFPGFDEPLDAARVTVAHELNHLLQSGAYSARLDAWMSEATATWIEDKVYPEVDDYVNYVRAFARAPGAPITAFEGGGGLKVYGSAVWNHWLEAGDRGYGSSVVRRGWEVAGLTAPPDFAIGAYGRAITGAGGPGFSTEFVDFAAASAEWRTGEGGFPDARRYPDVRRHGRLRAGRERAFRLHHTGYRLLRVPRLRGRGVRLVVEGPRGTVAGIALVGRRGGPVNGAVVRRARLLSRSGSGRVALGLPRRYTRITAVVVNADARTSGRFGAFDDWRYRKDGQRFRVRIIRSGQRGRGRP